MAEDKEKQPKNLLAVQLPPLMPLQIYGKKGEDCEPQIPKEVEPCRGEIPFSESPYIPLPPKEELPEIDIQPEEDFCVEIVEAPYLEKPIPGALEIPVEVPLEQALKNIKMEDIPVLPKPKVTLPNIVNAVVHGLRAWEPDEDIVTTLGKIKTTPATVGQLMAPRPKRRVYSAVVERRIFSVQAFPFWVIDFGDQIVATFGYETGTFVLPDGSPPVAPTITTTALPFTQGLSFLTIPTTDPNVVITPFDGPRSAFTQRISSQSYAIVRDATIAFDPYSDFSGLPGDNLLALRSYAASIGALKAGQVTINNLPFPTVLPITSAIKMVGGISSVFTNNYGPPIFFNNNQFFVSEVNESTHQGPPAPIEIYLPTAGRYRIDISVPSRPVYQFGSYSAFASPVAFFWSGTLNLTLEIVTKLGAMAVREREPQEPKLPWQPPQPWAPIIREPEKIPTGMAKKATKKTKKKKVKKKLRLRTEPIEPYLWERKKPPFPPELAAAFAQYRPETEVPPYYPATGPGYSRPVTQPPDIPGTGPHPPHLPPSGPKKPKVPLPPVKPPTPVRSMRRYLLCWDKEKKQFEKKPLNPGVVCEPKHDYLTSGWMDEMEGLF